MQSRPLRGGSGRYADTGTTLGVDKYTTALYFISDNFVAVDVAVLLCRWMRGAEPVCAGFPFVTQSAELLREALLLLMMMTLSEAVKQYISAPLG